MPHQLKRVLGLVLLVAIWWYPWGNYWVSHWYTKWAVLLLAGAVALWDSLPWTPGTKAAFLFTLLSSLWTVGWYHPGQTALDQLALGQGAAYAAIALLCLPGIVSRMGNEVAWMAAFRLACVANLFAMGWQYCIGVERMWTGGLLGNPSMNSSFLAVCLPLFNAKGMRFWVFPLLAGIVYPGASQPMLLAGLVALVMGTQALIREHQAWGGFEVRSETHLISGVGISLGLIAVVSVAAASLATPEGFANPNGRVEIWKIAFTWWDEFANPWVGTGNGTLGSLLPSIQYDVQRPTGDVFNAFWFLHSDWLQILFETGIVGLSLAFGVLYETIKGACQLSKEGVENDFYLPMVVGYAGMMLANYPLHLPLHALLGAWLVHYTTARKV